MFGNYFDVVVQAVKEWTPKRDYATEGKYRDDLLRFLRERLKPSESVGEYILGSGSSELHIIKKEAGRHLADIGIDDKIGIELKLNLKRQREIDRLVGQVTRFLNEYSHILVVLCGCVEQENIDVLKHQLNRLTKHSSSLLGAYENVIKVISKDKSQISRNPFCLS
jgi:hypothetical protein